MVFAIGKTKTTKYKNWPSGIMPWKMYKIWGVAPLEDRQKMWKKNKKGKRSIELRKKFEDTNSD